MLTHSGLRLLTSVCEETQQEVELVPLAASKDQAQASVTVAFCRIRDRRSSPAALPSAVPQPDAASDGMNGLNIYSGFSGKVVQNLAIFNDGRCTSPYSLLKISVIAFFGEEQHEQLFQSSKRSPRAVKKGKYP